MRRNGVSCHYWNDGRKEQLEKTKKKDVGLTNKVAKYKMSDRCTKSKVGSGMLGMS